MFKYYYFSICPKLEWVRRVNMCWIHKIHPLSHLTFYKFNLFIFSFDLCILWKFLKLVSKSLSQFLGVFNWYSLPIFVGLFHQSYFQFFFIAACFLWHNIPLNSPGDCQLEYISKFLLFFQINSTLCIFSEHSTSFPH